MARTINQARKRTTQPEIEPQQISCPKRKERKITKQQIRTIDYPTDVSISTFDHGTNCKKFENKFSEHSCSAACFDHLPVINWSMTNENTQWISETITFPGFVDFSSVCDERAGEESTQVALNILGKVIQEIGSYSVQLKECEREETGEVVNATFEYSKCGSKCFYKRSAAEDFEFVFLLVSEEEYLLFGQIGCHAFYMLPGLEYCNSDGSSPNVCSEEFVTYNDETESDDIILLSLSQILENAEEFLNNVLGNRYH